MARVGLGPVFVAEMVAGARRRSTYVSRVGALMLVLAGLGVAAIEVQAALGQLAVQVGPIRALALWGSAFYLVVSTAQVTLALLVAPAATAGAICLDRERGSLTHMMVTDLRDSEIVLGKLAGRIVPVFALLLATAPVLVMSSMVGGVIPESVPRLLLVTLLVALLTGALALTLSVRMRRSHEVLTVVYALLAGWILLPAYWPAVGWGPLPGAIRWSNPYLLVWQPYLTPGVDTTWELATFAAGILAASTLLLLDANRMLRAEGRAGWARFAARWDRWRRALAARMPGPGLDPNPVLWREWRRRRPSLVVRAIWGLIWAIAIPGFAIGAVQIARGQFQGGVSQIEPICMFVVLLGLLLISATTPAALAEERARGSLDVLLSTPMTTRAIVNGKWWGAYRSVPWLAAVVLAASTWIASTAPDSMNIIQRNVTFAAGMSVTTPKVIPGPPTPLAARVSAALLPPLLVLAHGAVLVSLGLFLATRIRNTGTAMAVSVTCYVLGPIGGIGLLEVGLDIVAMLLNGTTEQWVLAMIQQIPDALFQGMSLPLVLSAPMSGVAHPRNVGQAAPSMGLALALGVLLALAAFLHAWTLRSFDRCMGRATPRRRGLDLLRALKRPSARRTESATPEPA